MRQISVWVAVAAMLSTQLAHSQLKFTTIYSFQAGSDGAFPFGGLTSDSSGALYGTTFSGGGAGQGTVFKLTPPSQPGAAWTETVLYSFQADFTAAANPGAGLIIDSAGALYGTTELGGASRHGTVFKLSPPSQPGGPWTETVLYSFAGGNDGATPTASLTFGPSGVLYGTTYQGGGACNCGTVFRLKPPAVPTGAWTETILHAFEYNADGRLFDGASPLAPLVLDRHGALYGTTSQGGPQFGSGTAFQLRPPASPSGAWTTNILHGFTSHDGSSPSSGLVFDASGALYGATVGDDANQSGGEIFKLTPPPGGSGPWTRTVLHRFQILDGSRPMTTPVFDRQGNLFGTTWLGGFATCITTLPGCGTVYKLSPPAAKGAQWIPTILHRFADGTDGAYPLGTLIFGKTGLYLYGTTRIGGAFGFGAVYQIER